MARWRRSPASARPWPSRPAHDSRWRSAATAARSSEFLFAGLAREIGVNAGCTSRSNISSETITATPRRRKPSRIAASSRCVFGSSCCSPTNTTSAFARSASIVSKSEKCLPHGVVDALRHVAWRRSRRRGWRGWRGWRMKARTSQAGQVVALTASRPTPPRQPRGRASKTGFAATRPRASWPTFQPASMGRRPSATNASFSSVPSVCSLRTTATCVSVRPTFSPRFTADERSSSVDAM